MARAAALASSMSADALAFKLAERKQQALQLAGPQADLAAGQEPGKGHGSPTVLSPRGGPISKRFPAFAQHTRSPQCTQSEEAEVPVPQPVAVAASMPAMQHSSHGGPTQAEDALESGKDIAGKSTLPAAPSHQAEAAGTPEVTTEAHRGSEGIVAKPEERAAESDGSDSSSTAFLPSPVKKPRADYRSINLRREDQIHGSLTAGLDVAILTAMAVPRLPIPGNMTAGNLSLPDSIFSSKGPADGSAGRISPRNNRKHGKSAAAGRSRRSRGEPALHSDVSMSGGSASSCPAQLRVAGREFERALFDSNASR